MLFLMISDAPVSLLSELVKMTHLVTSVCFRTTHLRGWMTNGLRLGRFIKAVFNASGQGCTSVLSFRVIEASLMLEATFWRQFLPRVALDSLSVPFRNFFVGVCRYAESGLGPPPLGDYLPPTSVLHRLSAELYSISNSALSTWGALRRSMAAGGFDWPAVLSEEPPEGPSSSREGERGYFIRSHHFGSGEASTADRAQTLGCLFLLFEDVTLYESASTAGLRFPIQPFIRELLDFLSLAPGQDRPEWVEGDHYLYGDSGETLTRSTLAPVWKDRVLRAHRLTTRAHTYYIQPELLFRHSFGPEPTTAVLSLIETNKKRVATMKINKSKLKDMVEKGVPVVPVSVKRKRTDDGPSSAPPTPSVRPSKTVPLVQASPSLPSSPPVVQIPDEEIPFVPFTDDGPTICRSLGLAAKRAEVAITELDFKEYAIARTEEISKLMSLNEAMVVSRRCLTAEDDLIRLKQRLAKSEASKKNMKRAVFELTAEKRDLLATVDSVKVKGARAAAISDYKASEAFEENNLQCFYSGFEAFRKQAKQKYPDLDFTDFQPYDDTDSVNEDGRKDDRDQADDATS
uniref:Uncharacterized protein n=1 Tax=Fagus sylvatica TaxID=28930 RepID=A0A2N9ES48_FAGSY